MTITQRAPRSHKVVRRKIVLIKKTITIPRSGDTFVAFISLKKPELHRSGTKRKMRRNYTHFGQGLS